MPKNQVKKFEYQRIRNYVINMVFRAGNESLLLPSARDLQRRFKVAIATVTKALNTLHADGYTIVRRGIGTFTNPQRQGYGVPMRVVGYLINRGQELLNDYSNWNTIALAGLELTKNDCVLRELHFDETVSGQRIIDMLSPMGLDGIIYSGNNPEILTALSLFAEDGLPVVVLMPNDNFCSYDHDLAESSRQLGHILIEESRRSVYCLINFSQNSFLSGFERAAEEAGKPLDITMIPTIDKLKQALQKSIPDAIYITGYRDKLVLDWLEEKHIDFQQRCRLVSFRPKIIDKRFCGWHQRPAEEKIAETVANDMLAMMNGTKLPVGCRKFPCEFLKVNM